MKANKLYHFKWEWHVTCHKRHNYKKTTLLPPRSISLLLDSSILPFLFSPRSCPSSFNMPYQKILVLTVGQSHNLVWLHTI